MCVHVGLLRGSLGWGSWVMIQRFFRACAAFVALCVNADDRARALGFAFCQVRPNSSKKKKSFGPSPRHSFRQPESKEHVLLPGPICPAIAYLTGSAALNIAVARHDTSLLG